MTEQEDELQRRLSWVTGLKLVVLTLLLGTTAFFYLRGNLSQYRVTLPVVFTTIGVAYALAGVQAGLLRRRWRLTELAVVQLVVDQCLWTAIVYVSGGASSGATSFYGLTVLVGAVVIGSRGAAVAAASGLLLYIGLCLGFATHKVMPPLDQPTMTYAIALRDLIYPVILNTLGIVIVAALSGYLAERLRKTGGELEVATRRYTEAERLAELGRIAAWLAHEIRNPLGSISGSVEMLREAPGISVEDRELCEIVSREVARLNDLVGDMMDLSKPRKPHAESVDVAGLARDVVALASKSASSGSTKVVYDGPTAPVLAKCDGPQMRQVLWNLVRNAVQATPAKGGTVTVHVEAATEVVLTVRDEGPGIDSIARRRIFDPFYTTRAHGAGIGLAVVKRIVDDHKSLGASIDVESSTDGGAAFRLTLNRTTTGLPPSRASIRPPNT